MCSSGLQLFVGANALSMIRHVHWAMSSAKTTNHNPMKTQIRSLLTLVCAASASLLIMASCVGYTVTLQQVGPNVVATGNGPINLTGLTFSQSFSENPLIKPGGGGTAIFTGPISSSVDAYVEPSGPTSFGSGFFSTSASSGSGDMVGLAKNPLGNFLGVPRGYVSGNHLSNMAIYSGRTLASLGVTPGTYVWTWGAGTNQNFRLKVESAILPAANVTNSSTRASVQTGSHAPIIGFIVTGTDAKTVVVRGLGPTLTQAGFLGGGSGRPVC
jgi:hypothetical protein